MIRTLIAIRYVLFGSVVAALALLVLFGRHVKYEQSLESFFASDDPAVIEYKKASKAFGNDNIVFVSYDDPKLLTNEGMARLAELAENLGHDHIEAVVDIQSLDAMPPFWEIDDRLTQVVKLSPLARSMALAGIRASLKLVGGKGSPFTVAGAVRAAKDDTSRADLKAKITSHPLMAGTVVGESGTSTAVVVRLKPMADQDPTQTVDSLRKIADDFVLRHKLGPPALVGPPVLLADGFAAIERDGRRLAAAGMVLIGLVTLSATQSLWWAIVPILAGWTVWLTAETVLATLGLKLSLSGGPLVAQIIVLTMPAASHLAIHFRDDLRKERDRRAAAAMTLRAVTQPIVWCTLTGAIGYAALLTSNVMPVFQFGAVLAVCTLVASLLTLAISPAAMLPPFPLEWPVKFGSTSKLGTSLNALTHLVVDHPGRVIAIVLLLVVPLASGMFKLHYESNYINAFAPDARVVRDYNATESRLGGIGLVSVVVPFADGVDRGSIQKLATFDFDLVSRRVEGQAVIPRTISLATVLDPDGSLLKLPAEQAGEAIRVKLSLIEASPQAGLLNNFWDRTGRQARVLARISERQEAPAKALAFDYLRLHARGQYGEDTYVTGLSYLLNRTTEGVIATQWNTIGWSVGSIMLMLAIAFRSLRLALLAILPTLLAVLMVLGLMGWIGIRLDIATALVGSVALGLSVDDTFHCLLQFRRHRRSQAFRESLFASYAVTGPGVLLSSLAVAAGFAVLRFSEFIPFSNFGTMVGIATLGSSIGNLILLPACLALGDRRAERKRADQELNRAKW